MGMARSSYPRRGALATFYDLAVACPPWARVGPLGHEASRADLQSVMTRYDKHRLARLLVAEALLPVPARAQRRPATGMAPAVYLRHVAQIPRSSSPGSAGKPIATTNELLGPIGAVRATLLHRVWGQGDRVDYPPGTQSSSRAIRGGPTVRASVQSLSRSTFLDGYVTSRITASSTPLWEVAPRCRSRRQPGIRHFQYIDSGSPIGLRISVV